jgi:L-2-hydroxyglutarate oxidase LhgO
VKGAAALWSPESGILDAEELMAYLRRRAEDGGAIFLWRCDLSRVERRPQGYLLRAQGQDEPLLARCVVNAGGLHADRVAEVAGLDAESLGYRLSWFKGEYFSLRRRLPIERLVYPLPGRTGLGVHLTVDRQGRQRLGPSAFPVSSLDYSVDPAHRGAFHAEASRYLEGLRLEDLAPGTAGIRPKLSPDGSWRDFVIAEEGPRGLPGWVNLVGIESPGLTASPAIADFVADLLGWER